MPVSNQSDPSSMPLTTPPGEGASPQDQLQWLNRSLEQVRAEIGAERARGPLSQAELEQEISDLQQNISQLETRLKRLKVTCAKRKTEISQWQDWFAAQDDHDLAQDKQLLDAEVTRRLREIEEKEAEISRLLLRREELTGEIEMRQVRIEALRAGVHDLPMEQDPRILALEKARASVAAIIAKAAAHPSTTSRKSTRGKSSKKASSRNSEKRTRTRGK